MVDCICFVFVSPADGRQFQVVYSFRSKDRTASKSSTNRWSLACFAFGIAVCLLALRWRSREVVWRRTFVFGSGSRWVLVARWSAIIVSNEGENEWHSKEKELKTCFFFNALVKKLKWLHEWCVWWWLRNDENVWRIIYLDRQIWTNSQNANVNEWWTRSVWTRRGCDAYARFVDKYIYEWIKSRPETKHKTHSCN